ncbi:hypothetical protein AG4045_023444, partial [Apium graveolens]
NLKIAADAILLFHIFCGLSRPSDFAGNLKVHKEHEGQERVAELVKAQLPRVKTLKENILEFNCLCLPLEVSFKASAHVDKLKDHMVGRQLSRMEHRWWLVKKTDGFAGVFPEQMVLQVFFQISRVSSMMANGIVRGLEESRCVEGFQVRGLEDSGCLEGLQESGCAEGLQVQGLEESGCVVGFQEYSLLQLLVSPGQLSGASVGAGSEIAAPLALSECSTVPEASPSSILVLLSGHVGEESLLPVSPGQLSGAGAGAGSGACGGACGAGAGTLLLLRIGSCFLESSACLGPSPVGRI